MFLIIIIIVALILLLCGYHKTSTELEVYKFKDWSLDKFNEIKSIKTPILFNMDEKMDIDFVKYNEFTSNIIIGGKETMLKIKDIPKDLNGVNMSNEGFLRDSLLINNFYGFVNKFDRDYLLCRCNVFFLNENSWSILKYHDNNSIYINILDGDVKIKLFLPNDSRIFDKERCLITGDMVCEFDPWKDNTIQCIEIVLKKYDILKIPRFWWYTMRSSVNFSVIIVYTLDNMVSCVCKTNMFLRDLITT